MLVTTLASSFSERDVEQLSTLLVACVENGASIGFFSPLAKTEARDYWREVEQEVAQDKRKCWVLRVDNQIVASVQLQYSRKPNGRHRAEIQRLMVDPDFRRRGFAELLLHHVEQQAQSMSIKLLLLLTRSDGAGPVLYTKTGFVLCGEIPDYTYTPFGEAHSSLQFYKAL